MGDSPRGRQGGAFTSGVRATASGLFSTLPMPGSARAPTNPPTSPGSPLSKRLKAAEDRSASTPTGRPAPAKGAPAKRSSEASSGGDFNSLKKRISVVAAMNSVLRQSQTVQRTPHAVARALDTNKQSAAHWNNVNSILEKLNDLTTSTELDETQVEPDELRNAEAEVGGAFAELDNDTRKQLCARQMPRLEPFAPGRTRHGLRPPRAPPLSRFGPSAVS